MKMKDENFRACIRQELKIPTIGKTGPKSRPVSLKPVMSTYRTEGWKYAL